MPVRIRTEMQFETMMKYWFFCVIAVVFFAAAPASYSEGQESGSASSTIEIVTIENEPETVTIEASTTVEVAAPAKAEATADPVEAPAGGKPGAKSPAPAAEKPKGSEKAATGSSAVKPPPELKVPPKASVVSPKPESSAPVEPAAATGIEIVTETDSSDAASGAMKSSATGSSTQSRELSVQNDFIKIVVNSMEVDTGRFLVRTMKGDPFRSTDDNKILIYGGAVPWTSFMTVRVDGENYVFGGPTNRRAGRDALYGSITEKPHVVGDNAIATRCVIAGLDVTQTLSIVGGPVTGLLDTIKITTIIRNPTYDPHRVGIRQVIDTLLGSNDASPFKVGDESITYEHILQGMSIPEYWIAYDSLEDPGVVARGTLVGERLTAPDRLVFSNWGKLADNVWDAPFNYGQSFQRADESDMDSAIALYWDEVTVAPGGELQYSTEYGIEYLNVAGDILSIGAQRKLGEWPTAKNQIKPRTMYAYIGNSSEIDLNDVEIYLDLPGGVSFAGDDNGMRKLGVLSPGMEKTVGWTLLPDVGAGGERSIFVKGRAREVEEVMLETTVTLLPPPEIMPTLDAPKKIARVEQRNDRQHGPYGPPFNIKLKCFNDGKYFVDNLRVKLILPEGLVLPTGVEKAVQSITRLGGGKDETFTWNVVATGKKSGALEYRIVIESDTTDTKMLKEIVMVDPLPVTMTWTGLPDVAAPKTAVAAELFLMDVESIGTADLSIQYNPEVLDVIRIEQGTIFVNSDHTLLPWTAPQVDRKEGMITGIHGVREMPLEANEGSLIKVHFRTRKPGVSTLEVLEPSLKNLSGEKVEFNYAPSTITVE